MTKVSGKAWNSVRPALEQAAREGYIDAKAFERRPTHVLDIYKMRRGRYKMIRIWCNIHLGTGARTDLFITDASNQPLSEPLDLFASATEREIKI